MKKTLFLAGMVLVSATCFAQKANVSRAKNLALSEEPKFEEARALIHEAQANPETKDQANTWLVAGIVNQAEVEKLDMNQMLGQPVDEAQRGAAAMEAYDAYMQADQLASMQMIDKKGKPMFNKKTGEPVIDTKTRKQIAQKLQGLYQAQDFIKYGIYLNENREYAGAYEAFVRHLSIPDLDMMDDKMKASMPKDSTYNQYQYYAALFAIQGENHPAAIALLEQLKDGEYEALTCAQFLYQEYLNAGDTTAAINSLKASIAKYPSEPWFLQNLINYYVGINDEVSALEAVNQAIVQDPTMAQYYRLRANFLENQSKFDEAFADYEHALLLDPDMADAVAGQGRCFYNHAVKVNEDAAYLDGSAYRKALDEMNSLFRQSMPYFERAHQMDPENRSYMSTLRTLYYRFDKQKEYEEMGALMGY